MEETIPVIGVRVCVFSQGKWTMVSSEEITSERNSRVAALNDESEPETIARQGETCVP